MLIKDNMANMYAKVTSTYMEFTLAFGPKPEFSFSFKYFLKNRLIQIHHTDFGFHARAVRMEEIPALAIAWLKF